MGNKIEYVTPTMSDLIYLSRHIKEADRKEVFGLGCTDMTEELLSSINHSKFVKVCRINDIPVAVFGIRRTDIFRPIGIAWLLTTNETLKHRVFVGRKSKEAIKAFMKDWELLYNFVDEGNDITIKWLKWLDAKIYPAKPMGLWGIKYHYFEFRRDV